MKKYNSYEILLKQFIKKNNLYKKQIIEHFKNGRKFKHIFF